MLYSINTYRYLQIPRGSCYESAKAIQTPNPGLKIIEQSWQIPRHARVFSRDYPPPPRMAADKCIKSWGFIANEQPHEDVRQGCKAGPTSKAREKRPGNEVKFLEKFAA